MNYFELYDIEETFSIDESLVKRKFYELSKRYHPDFYISEPEEKQQEILELSTLNNKAYQVLSDPRKRMEYVLNLHGLMAEGDKYQLPADFLMEMMEINEELMELKAGKDDEKLAKINKNIAGIEDGLLSEIKQLTASYSDQSDTAKENILLKIKDLYYRQKYLLRIRASLDSFVP